jgi:hypothetical protein
VRAARLLFALGAGPATAAASAVARTAPSPASWSFDAHRLICEIAWRELTPAVRERVANLIANDRPYERFSDACVWADLVRGDSVYDRYATAHYMNVPAGSPTVDPDIHCRETYCVIEAIRDLTDALANRSLDHARRREALLFLVHLVGDIHQPMHVARPNDRGGTDTRVRFFGEETNLHALWDVGLVQRALLDPWDGSRLWKSVTPAERRAWADLDPETWALESYLIAERQAYRGVAPGAALGEEYANANRHAVELRIVQAGYRLGLLLNRLLGS